MRALKLNILFSTLSILSVLLTGCGDGSASKESELNGIWAKSCSGGEIETTTLADGSFSSVGVVSGDANCGGGLNVTLTGSYEIGEAVNEPAGATAMDITYTVVNIAPSSAAIANVLNSHQQCGFTDWAAGVAKNVVGLTCGSDVMHAKSYTIYKLAGNQLQLGKNDGVNNGDTAETRERVLGDAYTKQN